MGLRLPETRRWIAVAAAVVCIQVLVSLLAARSFRLTAFGDISQFVLVLSGTLAVLVNAARAKGKARLFWALMTLGFGMWLIAQALWTHFEVLLRQEVPNPFIGDVVLFLHLVPMMAALAVRPHLQQDNELDRFGVLDFVLLLIWWLYLYLFLIIPWQFVHPSEDMYGRSFNVLYMSEHLVFLTGLALVWRQSASWWKTVYAHSFGAAALYAFSSIMAGVAIDFHLYYTGSLYDVPLVASMIWWLGVGLLAGRLATDAPPTITMSADRNIWAPRLAMLAVFSTPAMVAWAAFGGHAPAGVRTYRLVLTVGTMVVMGFLVCVKQHLLDQELMNLLRTSHHNLEEMRRMKDDLATKEQQLRWNSMELQRKNLELQEVSFTDPLTGTWNRRFLEETLPADVGQVLRGYQRSHESASGNIEHGDLIFLMVDVDFFKRVNDDYGHTTGDELLEKVAERLSRILRKSDLLVRWGGEEFLIMSRAADRSGAPVFCNRILEAISSEPFVLSKGIKVRKTCSIGWAPYPWCRTAYEALCAEEVIELADTALYCAKGLGRNQSVGFLPSERAIAAPDRILMENMRDKSTDLIKQVRTQTAHWAHRPGE